ncbi:tetratricopeptide repeat protein [Pseudonocardia endophytica]|uniref:Tetratricopeptide repeat protein n=1 Tax=Pseudonocardia endophytica TaxID=401976 RepID=A0A4R1HWI6_PSEEN|nr:tetratricopeptide repeat protein [Pseudonocardia endophytica]TCK25821.1 tetratricopeptide repeat protein [Pseudonocardia endophytica]
MTWTTDDTGAEAGPSEAVDERAVPRPRRAPEETRAGPPVDAGARGADLHERGEYRRARTVHENLLDSRRRRHGHDHPDTLAAATGLAMDLLRLDENEAARALVEDTLARQRHVLGDDHPDTLVSTISLAIVLRRLGDHRRARRIGRWVDDQRHARSPQ